MSDRDGNSFLWFLAGLGIGAAVGILYAPKAGDELRQQLRDVAEEGRENVKQRARQAREQAGNWADKGRDYLSQQKDQIRSAYEAGRQAYREATSAGCRRHHAQRTVAATGGLPKASGHRPQSRLNLIPVDESVGTVCYG